MKVDNIDFSIDPSLVQDNIPSELLEFTQPIDNLWESDDPLILNKAQELIEGYPNLYDKVARLFGFVQSYITYERDPYYAPENGTAGSAVWSYNNREDDCSEFTNLFVALARAAGVPAK